MSAPVLTASDLSKVYVFGEEQLNALTGLSLSAEESSLTAIVGPPGAGKSTLLRCLSLLDEPSSGSLTLYGEAVPQETEARAELRRRTTGWILPPRTLLPTLTVLENLTLRSRILGIPNDREWLDQLSKELQIHELLGNQPEDLDAGALNRVALASALYARPGILLIDDLDTGELQMGPRFAPGIEALLRVSADSFGTTVLYSTRSPEAISLADQVVVLDAGLRVDTSGVLPASLDEIAPPPPLSPETVQVVTQAESILRALPGPIPDAADTLPL